MVVSDKSFESYPPSYVAVEQKDTLGIDSEISLMSIDEDKESVMSAGFPDPEDEINTQASKIRVDEADGKINPEEGKEKNFPEQKDEGNDCGRGFSFDQQKPVGSTRGGDVFDSGCNLSGIRKILVRPGWVSTGWFKTRNVIRDVVLEFHDQNGTSSGKRKDSDFENDFDIDRDDSIIQIDVWTEDQFVTAIRFHLELGWKSKIYGELPDPSPPPTAFRGIRAGSRLVGVHGTRSKGFLQRLGFTFASPKNPSSKYRSTLSLWDGNDNSSSATTPDYYFSPSLSSSESDTVTAMKDEGWSDWFITNVGRFLAGFVIPTISFLIYKRIKTK